MQPVSCQTEMGARRRLLCLLCSLSPGIGVPGEGLLVYKLSVSERLQGNVYQWSVATYAWTKLLH